jgi:hypothetical protein
MKYGRINLALPAALAAATAALSVASYVALAKGEAFAAGPVRFALSDGYERAAGLALTRLPPHLAFNAAEERSRKALELSPYNNTARLRLAYLDWARTGRLTPAGVQALVESYDLAAFDHQTEGWRIRLALENWQLVPEQTRFAVRDEAVAYARTLRRRDVVALLRSTENPSGRVVALLWLRQLPGKPSFFDHAYRTTREQRRP